VGVKKARRPVAKASRAGAKARAEPTGVLARSLSEPFPYLEIRVCQQVSEDSLPMVFGMVKDAILHAKPAKVLVDMRGGSVALTISDLLGLVKMVIASFVGVIECFAVVTRPEDLLPEKFFEPAVTSRGLPAYVTTEIEDAMYWLGSRRRPAR
jgi:hypothetical protein